MPDAWYVHSSENPKAVRGCLPFTERSNAFYQDLIFFLQISSSKNVRNEYPWRKLYDLVRHWSNRNQTYHVAFILLIDSCGLYLVSTYISSVIFHRVVKSTPVDQSGINCMSFIWPQKEHSLYLPPIYCQYFMGELLNTFWIHK